MEFEEYKKERIEALQGPSEFPLWSTSIFLGNSRSRDLWFDQICI